MSRIMEDSDWVTSLRRVLKYGNEIPFCTVATAIMGSNTFVAREREREREREKRERVRDNSIPSASWEKTDTGGRCKEESAYSNIRCTSINAGRTASTTDALGGGGGGDGGGW